MSPQRPPNAPLDEPARPSPATLSFEEAMAELEGIVARIESGEIGLERSMAEYERGVALVARCRDVLTKAEQRVEELARTGEGTGANPSAGPSLGAGA